MNTSDNHDRRGMVLLGVVGVTAVAGLLVAAVRSCRGSAGLEGAGDRFRTPSVLDQHLDIIGILPDAEVAAAVGLTEAAVRQYRHRHGIPPPQQPRIDWNAVRHLLGTMPDHHLAELIGCTPESISMVRRRFGIPAFRYPPYDNPRLTLPWPRIHHLFGAMSDRQIASRLAEITGKPVYVRTVQHYRQRLGLPMFGKNLGGGRKKP